MLQTSPRNAFFIEDLMQEHSQIGPSRGARRVDLICKFNPEKNLNQDATYSATALVE